MKIQKVITLLTATLLLSAASTTHAAHHGEKHNKKDIVDVASAAGVFNTLVAAVTAADLVETLKSEGPFTVFAPTDEAFAKLPEGTVESLLKPENKDQLVAVLTYHVIPARVMAADVKAGRVATVNGSKLTLSIKNGNVYVDNALVTKTDVKATNGVVHIIDAVILPDT